MRYPSTPSKPRRIAAHCIHTPQGFLRQGVITLDAEGFIVSVEQDDRVDSRQGVEFLNGILIPGMVNAHCHLELSYLAGAIPRGGGFAAFAAGMRAARERIPEVERVKAAAFRDAQMWAQGISAVGDISNGDSTFGMKALSPIRYHTFIEVYGLGTRDTSAAQGLLSRAHSEGLRASLTPHSTYSLNENAFAQAASGEGPLSVHFMESRGEAELFEGRGELAEWYASNGWKCDFTEKYRSPAERIAASVAPGCGTLLVHDTFVGRTDADALTAHFGDALTWVLCPRSNDHINGACPPVGLLRESGARIAVGTDSLASNDRLNMIDELKAIRGVALAELLRWATLSGAQALGMEAELGSIEVGKRPGIVLLEGVDWPSMSLTPASSTRRII